MEILDIKKLPVAEVITKTIAVLQSGGLVLFPTETTYGAGVDATNQAAVNKLLSYKSRREGKPLSVMVNSEAMAKQYVEVNEQAHNLYEQFLPGPVTVVSRNLGTQAPVMEKIAEGVASEFGTLGIRIPDYELILQITHAFNKPITATSANASGKKRPYSVSDILSGLSEKQKNLIDLILDAGELPKNEPSTVIDTSLSTPVTLRNSNRPQHILSNQPHQHITIILSKSEQETKEIAGRLLLKYWNNIIDSGLVIALDGDLGMGKTIFTKGSAKFLNIEDTIKSPTYTYIEEYDYHRHQTNGQLFHLDMWKVDNKEMFDRLEINTILKPKNVVIIEWFSQIQKYIEPLLKDIKVIHVRFHLPDGNGQDENRQLEIYE